MADKGLALIGRAEKADFPDINAFGVPVKIDTGADASSIWGTAQETESGIDVVFFGEESPFYSGKKVHFDTGEYQLTRVANSFGHKEVRFKVKLSIKVAGRNIKGTFTIANRSNKLYPVLLGRRLLHGKFLVDVSDGKPLTKEERKRKKRLEKDTQNGRLAGEGAHL